MRARSLLEAGLSRPCAEFLRPLEPNETTVFTEFFRSYPPVKNWQVTLVHAGAWPITQKCIPDSQVRERCYPMEKDGLFGLLTGDPAEIIVVWKLRNGCMILVASHVFLDRYHGGSS